MGTQEIQEKIEEAFAKHTGRPLDNLEFGIRLQDLENYSIHDILRQIEQLVVPLIDNLSRDPSKPIKWPTRDVELAEFKQKLLTLTQYYESK